MQVDIAIIGGGIIGCAIAKELAVRCSAHRIVLIEKNDDVGKETSTRNSGVIHSGIHQDPSFLKTRLAIEGSALVKTYAKAYKIPIMHCGMVIPILPSTFFGGDWWEKMKMLRGLIRRAKIHGIKVLYLTSRGIRRLEPNIRSMGGLFIPEVAVIDADTLIRSVRDQAQQHGVSFLYKSEVSNITCGADYTIVAGNKTIHAKALINAAGLYADEIARMVGIDQYVIYPWRGEYYEVVAAKRRIVSRLIYLPPSGNAGFKGIHFSPRPNGRLYLGPNARLVQSKQDYDSGKTPAFVFHKAIHRFCPALAASDLTWAYAGIRARRAVTNEDADYVIHVDRRSPLLINLIGIDSPGLSAALAIGTYVADLFLGL